MSQIAQRRAAAAAAATNNPAYIERRDRIHKAASKVFHERGFQGTKLNDIAAEAGVDRASLYYYVGSKEQLFRDVVSEAVIANIHAAREVRAEDLTSTEKLSRMIQGLMASFETHYPYLYVFVQEDISKIGKDVPADDEWLDTVRQWNTEYFQLIRETISEGIGDGSFRTTLPPGVLANCIIGMLNHSHLWFRPGGLMDAAEIGNGLAQLLIHGLQP